MVCGRLYDTNNVNSTTNHDQKCPPAKRFKMISEMINIEEAELAINKSAAIDNSKETSRLQEQVLPQLNPLNSHFPAYSAPRFTNADNSGESVITTEQIIDFASQSVTYDIRNGQWVTPAMDTKTTYHQDDLNMFDDTFSSTEALGTSILVNETNNITDDSSVTSMEFYEAQSNLTTEVNSDNERNTPQENESERTTGFVNETDLLVDLQLKLGFNNEGMSLSPLMKTYTELAHILTSINAPAKVYAAIHKWAERSEPDHFKHPIQLTTLISQLAENSGLTGTFPSTSIVPLPSGNVVKVTKFDFISQLLSLLNDQELMQPENLIFGEDIFKRFPKPSNVVNDVNECYWFYRTQEDLCKYPNDILCPIIIYIDKTFVKGKPVEPISFTLGRNTRMNLFLTI